MGKKKRRASARALGHRADPVGSRSRARGAISAADSASPDTKSSPDPSGQACPRPAALAEAALNYLSSTLSGV